jgi:hypothetical protein
MEFEDHYVSWSLKHTMEIGYGAQYFWLKSLDYFGVWWFSTSP